MKSTLERLQNKLDFLEREKRQSSSNLERIQLLETQLVMYHEDFQTERKDRERAQNKVQEMEEQLEALRRQPVMTNLVHFYFYLELLYSGMKIVGIFQNIDWL